MVKRTAVGRKRKQTLRQAYDSGRRLRGHGRPRAVRSDRFTNHGTGHNSFNSKTLCTEWELQHGRTRFELQNLFRFLPLMRRITAREPTEALSPRFRVKSLDEEQNAELWKFLDKRQFIKKLTGAGIAAGVHGGAAVFMQINDQFEPDATDPETGKPMRVDQSKPVQIDQIREFGALTVIDKWDLVVLDYETDIENGVLYKPAMYQLTVSATKIHPSRLLIFHGIELSERAMFENRGWGGSIIDATFTGVMQYSSCKDFLLEAINRNTQGVFKFEDWKDAMTTEGGEDAQARLDFLSEHASAIGDFALDINESYEIQTRGLAGFGEAANVFVEAMVADTPYPLSILMGQTPGGLNSGENAGDWRSYTSYLGGIQVEKYEPQVLIALEYIVRARNSPLADFTDSLEIEWGTLFELSEMDKATVFSTTMTALGTGTLNQIIDQEEARSNTVLQENVELEEFVEEEGTSEITETPEEQEEMIGGEDVEEDQDDGDRGDAPFICDGSKLLADALELELAGQIMPGSLKVVVGEG